VRASIAGVVLLLAAGAASAHPLGNFTTNRQARIELGPDAVAVRYVVDMAELPTYRVLAELDRDGDGVAEKAALDAWAARLAGDVAQTLRLAVDGAPLALRPGAHSATTPPGAGGLPTLRAELAYTASIGARGRLVVHDDGFPGLPGWQEIVAVARPGVRVETSTASTTDRTNGLTQYPTDVLAAPPQMREASIEWAPGTSASEPRAETSVLRSGAARFGDRLTALLADRQPLSAAVVLAALATAVLLGAFHALTPGHGKTIVGAYLVGARGTWRHAVFLGLVVTATHTLGVYALGAATLVASAWVLPERLLPWLGAVSGLLVVAVGASLVRQRLAIAVHGHAHAHGTAHHHHHHDNDAHDPHDHDHAPPVDMAPTVRNLVALGVSGGLLPCPSALVVMLGAIALNRTAFGLALIAAFSIGLAGVLTGIGLALVYARRLFDRMPLDGRVARYMPVASAVLISLAGLAIVVEAVARIAV